jgi:3-deoxy-D-manno-octulosonic acid kinase
MADRRMMQAFRGHERQRTAARGLRSLVHPARPAAMTLREARTSRGGILYDPDLLVTVDPSLFDPETWRARGALTGTGGGRGTCTTSEADAAQWVLRRYRRGGVVGRWVDESFIYYGAERTRSYREITLLADMYAKGLPVPRPSRALSPQRRPLHGGPHHRAHPPRSRCRAGSHAARSTSRSGARSAT